MSNTYRGSENTDTLRCIVERITYQNEESGYVVLKVRVKGYNDLVTVVGNMASVNVGSVLSLYGEWKVDSKYGKQLSVVKWSETLPASVYGIEKYLGSGLIKGVGPKYARKIVDMFKEKTLAIIEETPEKLSDVVGIGSKRIAMIKKSWNDHKEIKNVMIFLQEHGVGASYATKIYKTYGNDSIETVKNNPYRLADDIWGIGFKTADTIAAKLGIDKESYMRCRGGVLYTLNELSNEGHCYANTEQLIRTAVEMLDIDKVIIASAIDRMISDKDIISENDDMLYLPPLYFCEVGTARLIKQIVRTPRKKQVKRFIPNSNMEQGSIAYEGIVYDEIQINAIKCAVESKFMVLTGGPGTGKTTTTIGIIKMLKENNLTVLLAAPTGRAAKRMTEATGMESKTIHRLLEFKPQQGYQKNEGKGLSGDVLVVDEASMVDIVIMYNLLKAVPPQMSVILIGDIDQLPSVGPGNVLRDIIDSGIVPVIQLEKIFRQAQGSAIIQNAHKVNKGEYLDLKSLSSSDFFFLEQDDSALIPSMIVALCAERLPKHYKIDPVKDIQVLCPMHRGETGAMNLNIILQDALNKNTLSIKRGGIEYRLHDKVMQIKNNYDKEVFNGDIGIISSICAEDKTLKVTFDSRPVEYDISETDELILSYATTIHKAQGSEYPVVVMPLSMSHYVMLQRNLLYTGITRAKKLLVLVGSKKAIFISVKNNKVTERNTGLRNRLYNKLPFGKEGNIENIPL